MKIKKNVNDINKRFNINNKKKKMNLYLTWIKYGNQKIAINNNHNTNNDINNNYNNDDSSKVNHKASIQIYSIRIIGCHHIHYHQKTNNHNNNTQEISERIRKLLEKCDYCKVFQIVSDVIPTSTIFISALQELQDERPNAIHYSTLLHSNQPSTNILINIGDQNQKS